MQTVENLKCLDKIEYKTESQINGTGQNSKTLSRVKTGL